MNKNTLPEDDTEKSKVAMLQKLTKESIMESITTTTGEMVTIANLKEAITNYLLFDNIYEYEDTTAGFCFILGRLEMSLIRRKQSLDEDRKALLELTDE